MANLTYHELARILQSLNKSEYCHIHAVARRYVSRNLKGISLGGDPNTVISSLFINACQSFLMRDGGSLARNYSKDAQTLDRALAIIKADPRHFNSLLTMRGQNSSTDVSVWALEQISVDLKSLSSNLKQHAKNITFFYCLGYTFASYQTTSLRLPSAIEANNVYKILIRLLQDAAPRMLQGMKTKYDPHKNKSEITRAMKKGRDAYYARSTAQPA